MPETTTIINSLSAAEDPVLVETPAQLSAAAEAWSGTRVLGIDTEFVRERTFRANLGLIQVSDGETAWLIDPISTGGKLEPLNAAFSESSITKVLHSASEDLEVLLQATGSLPLPMVDTQIACAMLGQPLQMGYHHAAEWLLGVSIDKDQTRSDWCRRPLRTQQLRYAALDVVLLPLMFEKLEEQLKHRGRWAWLQEDVERMRRRAMAPSDPENAYLRIAGIGRLDIESLRILQKLAAWREARSRQLNRPRGFVIPDVVIMAIASAKPANPAELQDIEGVHPRTLERYQDKLLALVAAGRDSSFPVEPLEPLRNAERRQLAAMRKSVRKVAARLEIDPALLASRKELEKLIRAWKKNRPIAERFGGWREDIITNALIEAAQTG